MNDFDGKFHAPGVYLNMKHEEHIADRALGYTGIKQLATNPVEWWWDSAWNPLRPPEAPKPAFDRGEAAHIAFLDGLKVYNRAYGIMPTARTHPTYADTIKELQALCEKHRLPTHHQIKEDLVDRLVRAKVKDPILMVEQRKVIRSGRRPISETDDNAIRMTQRMAMMSRKQLGIGTEKVTLRQAFIGGLHEVSVFWVDENGIEQRVRLDKLKVNASIDFKSITDWKKSDFKKSLLREMIIRFYIGQAAHYDVGRHELRKAVDEGRVFGGTPAQRKKLATIADAEEWAWVNVFAKLDGAPQVRAVVLDRTGPQYKKAAEQRLEALTMYLYYREVFGLDSQWFDSEVVWTPDDIDWPEWSVSPE